MSEEFNFFKVPLTEKEQLELSNLLNSLIVTYENEFADCTDEEELLYEFKGLYEMSKMLEDRALEAYDKEEE